MKNKGDQELKQDSRVHCLTPKKKIKNKQEPKPKKEKLSLGDLLFEISLKVAPLTK